MTDPAEPPPDRLARTTALVRLVGGLLVLIAYAVLLTATVRDTDAPRSATEQWVAESRDAFDRHQYTEALQPTLELTSAFPTQPLYAERLALIYQHLGRPVDEAAAWERVAAVSPTPVDVCPALPDAIVRASGLSAPAIDAFERCAAFDPENVDMLFYLGRAQERAGRFDLAAAAYRKTLAIQAQSPDALLGLARLDLKAGRLREAKEAAATVLASKPDDVDALLIAGLAAQRTGQSVEARRFFDRVLALEEAYPDAHIALGLIDLEAGRKADARRHFLRAVAIDPARRGEVARWLDRPDGGQ